MIRRSSRIVPLLDLHPVLAEIIEKRKTFVDGVVQCDNCKKYCSPIDEVRFKYWRSGVVKEIKCIKCLYKSKIK